MAHDPRRVRLTLAWAVWNAIEWAKRAATIGLAVLAACAALTETARALDATPAVIAATAPTATKPTTTSATAPASDSIATLVAQLKRDTTNTTVRFRLANAYYDAGRKEEALSQYQRILAQKPDYVEALVNMGNLLNEIGKSDQAVDALAKAIGVKPNDPLALASLGNTLYGQQKYAEAADLYRKALAADPKCYQAEYYWGVAFADAGIYREAIRHWQKVVDIAPNSSAAESARANIKVVQDFLSAK
jgi:tetratricopeptide (TPR) repeat protein